MNHCLFDECRALAKVKEEACKGRATGKYNTKVVPQKFKAGAWYLEKLQERGQSASFHLDGKDQPTSELMSEKEHLSKST